MCVGVCVQPFNVPRRLHKHTIPLKVLQRLLVTFTNSNLHFSGWTHPLPFSLWFLWELTEDFQQVGESRGHPVETEHTQRNTVDPLEAPTPALLLNSATTLHPPWVFVSFTGHSAVIRLREEPVWMRECELSIWRKTKIWRVLDEKGKSGWEDEWERGLPWAMLPSWVCLAPVWAQLPVGTNHGGLASLHGSWQLAHINTAPHSQTCTHILLMHAHVCMLNYIGDSWRC